MQTNKSIYSGGGSSQHQQQSNFQSSGRGQPMQQQYFQPQTNPNNNAPKPSKPPIRGNAAQRTNDVNQQYNQQTTQIPHVNLIQTGSSHQQPNVSSFYSQGSTYPQQTYVGFSQQQPQQPQQQSQSLQQPSQQSQQPSQQRAPAQTNIVQPQNSQTTQSRAPLTTQQPSSTSTTTSSNVTQNVQTSQSSNTSQHPSQGQRKPPILSNVNAFNQFDINSQQPLNTAPSTTAPTSSNITQFHDQQQQQQQQPIDISQTTAHNNYAETATQQTGQPQSNKSQPVTKQASPKPITSKNDQQTTSSAVASTGAKKQNPTEPAQRSSAQPTQDKGQKKAISPPWFEFAGNKDDPLVCGWALRVQQVLSGDTLRLSVKDNKNHQSLITITLDGIRSPRVAKAKDSEDQPFGFEAREFVRKIVMNKPIFYAAWKAAKDNSHYYGDLYVQTAPSKRISLTNTVITEGWANLTAKVPNSLSEKEFNALEAATKQAKESRIGIFAISDESKNSKELKKHVRQIEFISENHSQLCDQFKNQEIDAIVDQVVSGSILRVELLPKKGKHKMVNVSLAGCNCERIPRPDNAASQNTTKNEPLAREAQRFTEERLSGQEVKVKMLSSDKSKNIYATIIHPHGQIAVALLKQGLGRYDQWTASQCSPNEKQALVAAVNEAKEKRKGIWKDEDPTAEDIKVEDIVSGTVVQILSPYTVLVKTKKGEERYTLSSIRAPHFGRDESGKKNQTKQQKTNPKTQGNKDKNDAKKGKTDTKKESTEGKKGKNETKENKEEEEIFIHEAKEFLRRKIIGKEVQVYKEYVRDVSNDGNPKSFATIYIANTKENVALSLIKAGFAEVINHRQLEPRSRDYELLSEAEKEVGKKQNKNKSGTTFSEKFKRKPTIDYTHESSLRKNDAVRTELQNFLKNEKKNAVVEFVFSGNRLKLYIPEKRCYIPFTLANVRCKNFSFRDSTGDKFGEKAYNFIKNKLWQRDVEIEVVDLRDGKTDQQTTFLGHLHFDGRNVAEELIEQGLAQVVASAPPMAKSKSGRTKQIYSHSSELPPIPANFLLLQEKAKEQKIGIWLQNEEELKENEEEYDETNQSSLTGQEKNVTISHIESATTFWVNVVDRDAYSLSALEDQMSKIPNTKHKVHAYELTAALFEGLYARAIPLSFTIREDNE